MKKLITMKGLKIICKELLSVLPIHWWDYYEDVLEATTVGNKKVKFKTLHRVCKWCDKIEYRDKVIQKPFEWEHWHNRNDRHD
jgi:hypothetical protein